MLYTLHCLRFVLIDILDILHVLIQDRELKYNEIKLKNYETDYTDVLFHNL